MGHVFVRLAGHGTRLVPYWPYRFAGSAGASTVAVTVFSQGGERRAVAGSGAASVPGVVDVDAGPAGEWRLEVGPFSLCWPVDFVVESPADPADGTPFYLRGPDEAMIFPQGPVPLARLAGPDALVAPGQRVLDRRVLDGDIDVVELAYAHDGVAWWQAHWAIPVGRERALVLTGQAPEAGAAVVRTAADRMAVTLTGVPDQSGR
ncbi:hypothetical protein ACGFI9_26105 [Micromonospora sp. NPDC048930]|uniref:hypothetical protein n=1 Tax=Micromonospora sp. NPDC048930 TaxID=3364261 RepID=UPI003717327B